MPKTTQNTLKILMIARWGRGRQDAASDCRMRRESLRDNAVAGLSFSCFAGQAAPWVAWFDYSQRQGIRKSPHAKKRQYSLTAFKVFVGYFLQVRRAAKSSSDGR